MSTFPTWAWASFFVFTATMLALDLSVFRKGNSEMSLREACLWCGVWFGLAVAFNGFVFWQGGADDALQWMTSYVVEICLSVDNLFVFILVFTYFKVSPNQQHRVLFWGILGAAIMRAVFIFVGIGLMSRFHWIVSLLFGAFLVITGIKLALPKRQDETVEPESNVAVAFAKRLFPVAQPAGNRFFVREHGRLCITPLFIVLLVIESTDLAFALDSIPAVIAITPNSFIAFTSNIFAILGLRSLYFALRGVMGLFRYLNVGLAIILIFIGVKMLITEIFPISTGISLLVIGLVLASTVAASLLVPEKK